MGKDKADKNPSKRLRENGSQTDEDDEHVGVGGVMVRGSFVHLIFNSKFKIFDFPIFFLPV